MMMSDKEFKDVGSYYYRSGSAEKAVAALARYVTSETLLESAPPVQFNPARVRDETCAIG